MVWIKYLFSWIQFSFVLFNTFAHPLAQFSYSDHKISSKLLLLDKYLNFTSLCFDKNSHPQHLFLHLPQPICRFCVGDKFYLCDNKILCEYDYEERLVFASMANHPILKRQQSGGNINPNSSNLPSAVSSPLPQNGHHHGMMQTQQRNQQTNDLNNNQNGIGTLCTPNHMKQVISSNWSQQNNRWPKWTNHWWW